MQPKLNTTASIVLVGASSDDTVTVPGAGAIPLLQAAFPAPAVANCPGVIVIVHEAEGASLAAQVDEAEVPLGQAGYAMERLVAATGPLLVIVICRGLPVSVGARAVLFTDSATAVTLGVKVVCPQLTATLVTCAVIPVPAALAIEQYWPAGCVITDTA